MESVSLYSEARNEYLKQMSTWIVPPLVEFFRREYATVSARDGRGRAMSGFQTWCSEVPRWNQDVIDANVNGLLDSCRCDYMEELMTAVFIAHTKMLTAIRVNTRQKKLQITLPKLDHFLHRVFIECARAFWKAPFLFLEELSMVEKQKNILQAESMCSEALNGAVRSLLPVKSILRDNLLEDEPVAEVEPAPRKHRSSKRRHSRKHRYDSSSSSSSSSSDSSSDEEAAVGGAKHVPAAAAAAPVIPAAAPVIPAAAAPVIPAVPAVPVVPIDAPAAEPITDTYKPVVAKTPTVSMATLEHVKDITDATVTNISSPTIRKPVLIQKDESVAAWTPDVSEEPPHIEIDTERSVHFTPYDTVFDETKPTISEMRYSPKVSVEDMPESNWGATVGDDDDDDVPIQRISFGAAAPSSEIEAEDEMSLGADDFETI